MLKSERKQIILSQLKQDGFVTLENLTVLLSDTSESTTGDATTGGAVSN